MTRVWYTTARRASTTHTRVSSWPASVRHISQSRLKRGLVGVTSRYSALLNTNSSYLVPSFPVSGSG